MSHMKLTRTRRKKKLLPEVKNKYKAQVRHLLTMENHRRRKVDELELGLGIVFRQKL